MAFLNFYKLNTSFPLRLVPITGLVFAEFSHRSALLEHAVDLLKRFPLALWYAEVDEQNTQESDGSEDESRLGVQRLDAVGQDKV